MSGKITLLVVCLIALSSAFLLVSMFSAVPSVFFQTPEIPREDPPKLSAHAWGVFLPDTGEVRVGVQIDEVYAIASITKLYTAYAALMSQHIHDPLTIEWSDLYTEGRAGKLTYGEILTPHELLFPLLLESSNDAGAAIERVLQDEFPTSITLVKTELGLTNTEIVDGSGLSSGNVSTVRELARFYGHIRTVEPHIIDITRLPLYIGDGNGWVNNNPGRTLLNFTGGKHGYTNEAGRTFIGTFYIPRIERELGIVLLKSDNLALDLKLLLAYLGGVGK